MNMIYIWELIQILKDIHYGIILRLKQIKNNKKLNLIFVILERKDVYMKEEWDHLYKDNLMINGIKKEIIFHIHNINLKIIII